MKSLLLICLLFLSFSVLAIEPSEYFCDMRNIVSGEDIVGISYHVIVDDDAKTASLYSTVVYPDATPSLVSVLKSDDEKRFSNRITDNETNYAFDITFSRDLVSSAALSFVKIYDGTAPILVMTLLCSEQK